MRSLKMLRDVLFVAFVAQSILILFMAAEPEALRWDCERVVYVGKIYREYGEG